jgi:4-amino-4-deoxy-L-arabinose transferase-like glycosyltransferase
VAIGWYSDDPLLHLVPKELLTMSTHERDAGLPIPETLHATTSAQRGSAMPPLPWWRARLWSNAALLAIAALAAFLYTWGLWRNGYANQYYAAAVLSMTQSWKAFFFATIDSVGFITIDKPPFAFWVQALSARIFGFSSWSLLLPQAVAGVATVFAISHLARRRFGAPAAALAGLVLALTPVTVALNRDNLPDTILVLLLVGGAWGTLSAVRTGHLRPLLVGAALVGLGFNTKMLQAYIGVPALALTYLVAAPVSVRRRIAHLLAAGAVLTAVSASWMVVVDAIPANMRPFIGGSDDNSVLNLVIGYNGFGRILGNLGRFDYRPDNGGPDPGYGGPGFEYGDPGFFGGPGFGGQPGWGRLFNDQVGGQISWLFPLAAVSLLAGLIASGRRPRTDGARAWYLLWGGWLATHFLVFSFAKGIFHPYYTTTMAPAIAALCGPGLVAMWELYRRGWLTAWLLPVSLGLTGAWSFTLLSRSEWLPWLRPVVLAATVIAIAGLLVGRLVIAKHGRQIIARSAVALGLVSVLAGPTAWASTPLQRGENAVIPAAGPADAVFSGFGRGRFGSGDGDPRGFGGGALAAAGPGGAVSTGGEMTADLAQSGDAPFGGPPPGAPFQVPLGGGGFGPGGRFGPVADQGLIAFLEKNRGSTTYLVAVESAMSAAPLILATRQPVMAMGGFSGRDPAPTVAQLQAMVASGDLRFVLIGNMRGFGRGDGERSQWVQTNCMLVDPSAFGGQGGLQLYDCART